MERDQLDKVRDGLRMGWGASALAEALMRVDKTEDLLMKRFGHPSRDTLFRVLLDDLQRYDREFKICADMESELGLKACVVELTLNVGLSPKEIKEQNLSEEIWNKFVEVVHRNWGNLKKGFGLTEQ